MVHGISVPLSHYVNVTQSFYCTPKQCFSVTKRVSITLSVPLSTCPPEKLCSVFSALLQRPVVSLARTVLSSTSFEKKPVLKFESTNLSLVPKSVILIVAADFAPKNKDGVISSNDESNSEELGSSNCEESTAQKALIRIFERILKVDEERSKLPKEESENGEDNCADGSGGIPQGPVVCRLLAASHQIGCVLGTWERR